MSIVNLEALHGTHNGIGDLVTDLIYVVSTSESEFMFEERVQCKSLTRVTFTNGLGGEKEVALLKSSANSVSVSRHDWGWFWGMVDGGGEGWGGGEFFFVAVKFY